MTTQYTKGGLGTWGITPMWSSTSGGPYDQAWVPGNSAVFETSGGNVPVLGTIIVGNITFNVAGVTISGGIIYVMDIESYAAGNITFNVSGIVTLSGAIYAGNINFNVAGVTLISGTVYAVDITSYVAGKIIFTISGGINFNMSGIITLGGAIYTGNVNFNASNVIVSGGILYLTGVNANIGMDTISSTLASNGGLTKGGTGTLKLLRNNTYSDQIILEEGTLDVEEIKSTQITAVNGYIKGIGTCYSLNMRDSSILTPGIINTSLTISNNLTLGNGLDNGSLVVFFPLFNGPTYADCDHVTCAGALTLDGVFLAVNLGYAPSF